MSVRISALYSYPIKSCAALVLTRSAISPSGLAWDREWVMVDADGEKMTQRTIPRMALIQPTIEAEHMRLQAPGMPDILVSLQRVEQPPIVDVQIWADWTRGQDEGDAVAEWLSSFLGMPCRLLRVHPTAHRAVSATWSRKWADRSGESAEFLQKGMFGFADGFPFLICNESSLDELNAEIRSQQGSDIRINRFRPNIVVQGLDAYEEDYVQSLQGGGHYFARLKNCTRCPLPNVNPETAEVGDQPSKALASSRRSEAGILFGINMALYHASESPFIEVGQTLEVEYDV